MSMFDSDTSSQGNGDKHFRQISRDRLLYEMIRSAKRPDSKSSNWKVLIMDRITVKIMSCSCKMADITDEGVSLVEQIHKRRQPLPSMDAVYYIQPTKENVDFLLADMAGKAPLYKEAYVFFSSSVSKELVADIKKEPTIKSRLRGMKEMNLEYFAIDSQCFITDHGNALEELYGDEEFSRKGDECLTAMANRIATVFASMLEFPFVRYRAAKSLDPTTMTTFCDLIPTKLAAAVWNNLMKYKTLNHFPQIETCDLLILDRSIDQIAPVIHEWTYDAMCHDLLEMDGNKYVHVVSVPSKIGDGYERKEVLLEDHDPVWLELRHSHIADASERLHDKMTNFVSRNKAAQMHGRDGGEMSTRDLQKMVQALPQYNEQMDKLSLHVDLAGKINGIIREMGLREVGQLEQDLVFGDAGTKDIIKFLKEQDATDEQKIRLLMIYVATHPEKFETDKLAKILELADLLPEDMKAIYNMRFLESAPDSMNTSNSGFPLKFDNKKRHGLRKDRPGEEAAWQLSRFYPIIEELIEKLSKNELPVNEYPCMNDPSPTFHGASHSVSARVLDAPAAHSMRSRRATWARPRNSDDDYSSDSILRRSASEFIKRRGKRIFVFIVGGATRSEMRVIHKLTTKLSREIILGSSSLDDPAQFIEVGY
ncbi:hypothetical protein Lser_V15G27747 [Lactuca serriola]